MTAADPTVLLAALAQGRDALEGLLRLSARAALLQGLHSRSEEGEQAIADAAGLLLNTLATASPLYRAAVAEQDRLREDARTHDEKLQALLNSWARQEEAIRTDPDRTTHPSGIVERNTLFSCRWALAGLLEARANTPVYCEIVNPSGRVSYRRMSDHPDVQEALRTPGYSVRRSEVQP